jgi:hypothetical protein
MEELSKEWNLHSWMSKVLALIRSSKVYLYNKIAPRILDQNFMVVEDKVNIIVMICLQDFQEVIIRIMIIYNPIKLLEMD